MESDFSIGDQDLMAEIDDLIDLHLEEGEPEITRSTLKRLSEEGFTDFQARELIAQCVAYELTSDRGFSEKRFTTHLSSLPDINFEW
ncbi:MAG: hypothetical protein R6U19_01215 [Bacteroidales bacterium]